MLLRCKQVKRPTQGCFLSPWPWKSRLQTRFGVSTKRTKTAASKTATGLQQGRGERDREILVTRSLRTDCQQRLADGGKDRTVQYTDAARPPLYLPGLKAGISREEL